ncbi:hypothetical protein CEUSTIGMA_g13584.t1 [Chlamydomonas eustigma]|uniref:Uncharacterized protein n=1 Tax=Chlamydomonas eustigma TaxID=1157962 RepID=A0A250XSU9_9CHLO|nr:hypothetical protein CEUSTIGMA_g13584.t1 [Chlamydomonas eustigma]|eukprot:GAX86171.1 hypothetical protein CEUSTIGMA_g13584.t1 [Chlamydomonas eustigma]
MAYKKEAHQALAVSKGFYRGRWKTTQSPTMSSCPLQIRCLHALNKFEINSHNIHRVAWISPQQSKND